MAAKLIPRISTTTKPIKSEIIPPETNLLLIIDTQTKSLPLDLCELPDNKKIVTNIAVNIVTDLIKNISKDFNINVDDLKSKYLIEFSNDKYYGAIIEQLMSVDRQEILKIYAKKQDLLPHAMHAPISQPSSKQSAQISNGTTAIDPIRCYAKTAKLLQCSRKKKSVDHKFCGGHELKQPYGCIDDEVPFKQVEKKRGRPSKNQTNELEQMKSVPIQSTQIVQNYKKGPEINKQSKINTELAFLSEQSDESEIEPEMDVDKFDLVEINDNVYAIYTPTGDLYPTTIDDDGVPELVPNTKPVGKKDKNGKYILNK